MQKIICNNMLERQSELCWSTCWSHTLVAI